MKLKKSNKVMILAVICISAATAIFSFKNKKDDYKTEQQNMIRFHLVDFVGWNTNMKALEYYHSKNIKAFNSGGINTVGLHDHIKSFEPLIKKVGTSIKLGQHSPNVARGKWVGVVGIQYPGKEKMATVAKWENGLITEEYILFGGQLSSEEASKIKLSAKPIAHFESPDDETLANSVDIQPGWSCTLQMVNGVRTAIFIKKVNGKETERMAFQ
ncbi:hypothetical protein SAMN05880574_12225 [Chryseobacterium sp. RU37D]|uniref:hypothetical protein n=1 Tax=Chryseobacterium sp. RU37D TaxID=1907397 RepID=UPI0009543C53|nr:hypothetical protein [Chryseobacterium sp. RU37D]SIQ71939.1 hypothetical protein SAMN05880574_12225 [Chryseobacterium sp. RU37D]